MFALDDRHPVRPVNLNLGFRVRIFNLFIYICSYTLDSYVPHACEGFLHTVESARFRHLEITEDTKALQ